MTAQMVERVLFNAIENEFMSKSHRLVPLPMTASSKLILRTITLLCGQKMTTVEQTGPSHFFAIDTKDIRFGEALRTDSDPELSIRKFHLRRVPV